MRATVLSFFVSMLLGVNAPAQFGESQFGNTFGGGQAGAAGPATKAKLLLSHDTAKPGTTITAGIELKMDKGWHTYWLNPGAAGIPTSVEWTLPKGITAGKSSGRFRKSSCRLIPPDTAITTKLCCWCR